MVFCSGGSGGNSRVVIEIDILEVGLVGESYGMQRGGERNRTSPETRIRHIIEGTGSTAIGVVRERM